MASSDPVGLTDPFERCLMIEMLLTALLAEFIGFAPVMKRRLMDTLEQSQQADDERTRRIVEAAGRFLDSIGPTIQ